MTDQNVQTVALRARIGFGSLNDGEIFHVPLPVDEHYLALMDIGLVGYAYPEDNPAIDHAGTVLSVGSDGEATTVLGVMPAGRRRRSGRAAEAPDGETDSE